jgi:hypothetical protein|tara:strand:- start:582 stop:788 length:207 start_codon:yes stop_codon:yes gene_type:complete
MSIEKLQRGQIKLLEVLDRQRKSIDELKELFLKTWRAEDMEENDGKFRWPFDEHGNLLDNVNMTRRID